MEFSTSPRIVLTFEWCFHAGGTSFLSGVHSIMCNFIEEL